ncbi:MAG TPA: hypothetical protein VM434_04910 [Beijerinckiaceae bacterium]|nr:hypothetical protein [Beijerinckiaceae bacterium]
MAPTYNAPSPIAELVTLVLKLGRKCPDAHGDVLELMLLASRIQAFMEVDHGYRHARHVVARLREPPWDDLTPEDRELLARAADAIARACKLGEEPKPEAPPADGKAARTLIQGGLKAACGDELTPAQIERITATVVTMMANAGRLPASRH